LADSISGSIYRPVFTWNLDFSFNLFKRKRNLLDAFINMILYDDAILVTNNLTEAFYLSQLTRVLMILQVFCESIRK